MLNNLVVYDFETSSPDSHTCQPVQLAACVLHPISFEPLPDSFFCTYMRPEMDNEDKFYSDNLQTILWHAKNYKTEPEKIFEIWKKAPPQKDAWNNFVSYLGKYNKNPSRPNRFGAPCRAGMNIRRFDDNIIERLCKKYGNLTKGEPNIFHPRDVFDLLDMCVLWLHPLAEPENYNMSELRKFFGLSEEGSHDALKDVKDEAEIIGRFMKLHRNLAPRIKFKDCVLQKEVDE